MDGYKMRYLLAGLSGSARQKLLLDSRMMSDAIRGLTRNRVREVQEKANAGDAIAQTIYSAYLSTMKKDVSLLLTSACVLDIASDAFIDAKVRGSRFQLLEDAFGSFSAMKSSIDGSKLNGGYRYGGKIDASMKGKCIFDTCSTELFMRDFFGALMAQKPVLDAICDYLEKQPWRQYDDEAARGGEYGVLAKADLFNFKPKKSWFVSDMTVDAMEGIMFGIDEDFFRMPTMQALVALTILCESKSRSDGALWLRPIFEAVSEKSE